MGACMTWGRARDSMEFHLSKRRHMVSPFSRCSLQICTYWSGPGLILSKWIHRFSSHFVHGQLLLNPIYVSFWYFARPVLMPSLRTSDFINLHKLQPGYPNRTLALQIYLCYKILVLLFTTAIKLLERQLFWAPVQAKEARCCKRLPVKAGSPH